MTDDRGQNTGPVMDAFNIFGLPVSANSADVARAFRQRVLAVHPDHNPVGTATEDVQRLIRARDQALRDCEKAVRLDEFERRIVRPVLGREDYDLARSIATAINADPDSPIRIQF